MPVASGPPVRDTRATVVRHASAVGWWEIATAPPCQALQPYAQNYVGWMEQMASPIVRREPPTESAPLIFSFGAPIRLYDLHDPAHFSERGSFITGAYDCSQLVGSADLSGGVQINFTLLGIRHLVGRPLADLRNQAVPLDDVFGRAAASWTAELYEAPTWDHRFRIVDRVLGRRLAEVAPAPPRVRHAWQLLIGSGGLLPVAEVARRVDCSPKHLIAQFRQEIGLSPKDLARIVRFGRVIRRLKRGEPGSLAGVALECGYYDQSHLNRDTRQFADATPGELAASLLPDGGGFLAEVNSVQDAGSQSA